jgi:DNA/RNA-binding domain of Phe-tRNA-synthetase-like protein
MILEASAAWRAAYPGAHLGILALDDVANPPHHAALDAAKAALEVALRRRFAGADRRAIAALPAIRAYDAYYKRFNKTYHVQLQLESVALKGKALPKVAALVECMFMAEIEDQLLTAGHDADLLVPPLALDVATGAERYTTLRGAEQELKRGDMFLADRAGAISSVIHGPDRRTAITPATRRVVFTAYAPPGIEAEAVRLHLENIRAKVALVAPEARLERLEVLAAGEAASVAGATK